MKALIAMSGGVDSSVAALLTKNMGYDCIGCTMRLFDKEGENADQEIKDAHKVAEKLGMPFHSFEYRDEFKKKVIDKFVKSYEEGLTPNPCLDCNKYMKFGRLYEEVKRLGCDKIVTGHYARIEEENGKFLLKRALDETKDQSYVLYQLTSEQLSHTLFPLGELSKTEVREIAEKNGFINAKKKDSQDICFVPNGDYASVIKLHSRKEYKEGDFVDKDGKVLGKHKGIINYTIGQRRGLGISSLVPLYVCKICKENNTVCLCENRDLFSKEAYVKDVHFINPIDASSFECQVKVRYSRKPQKATVIKMENNTAKIIFDEPERAITPGQAAVFYQGDTVLGGGVLI